DAKSFSPALFQKALKFLYLHARHVEKYLSTYFSPNTHLTGEALGLYYLGTQLKFFTQSREWRRVGEEILLSELDKQILPDGVYFEQSTWYQRYTADFYTQFLILKDLDSDKNSRGKLVDNLQKQLDFLMFVTRPDGTTPLVGDDDGGRCLPLGESEPDDFRYLLSNGATLFGRGDYKFVAKNLSEETIWLFGAEGAENFETLGTFSPEKTSKDFPAGGYYLMRDGWADTDNYFLIDGGNLGAISGGHSHADSLMIDCAAGGKTFLRDAGTYTYHESKRARDYFRSTQAHNTLSINEKSSSETGGKFNWQTTAKSEVNSWISDERFDFFEGSHDGYRRFPHSPATHERSVLFLKNDYWIVRDYVETSGANDYQLNFHFDAKTNPHIETAANGSSCVGEESEKDAGLRLFTFGDNGGWRRKEGWVSPCYGKRVDAPFLQFVSNGIGSQEFFTFLLPTNSLMDKPEVFETEISGGRAFVVEYRDYRDLLIFGDGAQIIRTEFFDTDFRFFWARLSEGEDLPEEFVMTHGTKFNLGGREIINYPQKLKFAAARRLGNRLNVRTDESVFSLALSQYRSTTRILKNSDES
ncbi:MAG: alginate lyase family protein, partial [Pyrinomonadaceae bacterium]